MVGTTHEPQFLELVPSVFSPSAAPSFPRADRRPVRRSLAAAVLAGLLVAASAASAVAAQRPSSSAASASTASDATTSYLEGIDVSNWQGTIDWTKVAGAGKRFAILKATESTNYSDPTYATNHAAAQAAGLWTGAYHFAQPSATANDAILEADWFVGHVKLGKGDLIPALDLEVSGGLGVAALQAWVKAFLDEVIAKVGIRPMIYTSPSFWKTYMGDSQALADVGYKTLWVAHWGVTSPTVPANNWGGHGWTFWQYTSSGTVPGISGRVDLDRFNGPDLTPQAYSNFKLATTVSSAAVKQGANAAASVSILRTNFTSGVALQVSGLPAGATATFAANPSTASTAAFSVATNPDPAATPVGTYPLTITGVAGGLTRTTRLSLVVGDGIPPTLVAPLTRLWAGRTLGTSSVPVHVTWGASDPSGVASTALQQSVNGGSWSTAALPSVAATSADTSIPFGSAAVERVRATDTKGNVAPWLTGAAARVSVYQQTSTTVKWGGTWQTSYWSSASGGSARSASSRGAWATFSFTGTSVAWVAAKGSNRGSASIYVDGVYVTTISLYSASGHSRAIVFAKSWPTVGAHTLHIVVAGTAGHPRVDVDAFVRLTPA